MDVLDSFPLDYEEPPKTNRFKALLGLCRNGGARNLVRVNPKAVLRVRRPRKHKSK